LKADASIPELGQSSGNALMSTSGLLWREREREGEERLQRSRERERCTFSDSTEGK